MSAMQSVMITVTLLLTPHHSVLAATLNCTNDAWSASQHDGNDDLDTQNRYNQWTIWPILSKSISGIRPRFALFSVNAKLTLKKILSLNHRNYKITQKPHIKVIDDLQNTNFTDSTLRKAIHNSLAFILVTK